jgi:glycosyltransferase involved in cell wall biosynthesis
MKVIIILATNPFYENSASGNRWRTLIEGLNALGVKITLLIIGGYKSIDEIKTLKLEGTINGIQIKYINFLFYGNIWFSRMNSYILSKIISPLVRFRIYKIVGQNKDSILWTSSELEGFKITVGLKKRFPELKTFLEMSEFLDIYKFNKSNAVHTKRAKYTQFYFENVAMQYYEGLALMTKTLYNHYSTFNFKKPVLLHLPMTVDLKRFEGNKELLSGFKQPYIAFVGIMNNAKDGVDILIEAFAKINDKFPEFKLYLVGPWHYDTPDHLNMIKQFKLKDKIFWKGEHPRDEVTNIIKNAHLLVLPRPDSKQAQGGFPTKLGEYLASGNPVCATTVGEIPHYLKDNESVFFAEPSSIDSFTKAMERALSDSIIAKNIGFKGKEVAKENFDKNKQSLVLFNFLNKLIEN